MKKKIIKYLLFSIVLFVMGRSNVNAASCFDTSDCYGCSAEQYEACLQVKGLSAKKKTYECPKDLLSKGYKLVGNKCIKTEKSYQRNGYTYCDPTTQSGAIKKGEDCVWEVDANIVYIDEPGKIDEVTCESNQISFNSKCYVYSTSAHQRQGQYYCTGKNEIVIGVSCYVSAGDVSDPSDDPIVPQPNGKGCAILSEPIKEKINWALNLIKYGGVALAILFGMVDFMKAVGSDEDNATKKAGGRLAKRLIAAAIIFLVPLVLQFILNTVEIPGFNKDDVTCGIGVSE